MNLSYYISERISTPESKSFSSTIHKIAIASIGISLATMILSFAILLGFQGTIKEKIFSFGSHLIVNKFSIGNTFAEPPVSTDREFYRQPEKYDFIKHIQSYSYKPGLLKNEEEVLGVILKGVDEDFNLERFKPNLKEGNFINFDENPYSTEVIVSKIIANKLILEIGDEVNVHFFQNPPRVRRLKVTGFYETWIEDFDEKVILVDIGMIRRLNSWGDSTVGGFEIFIDDFSKIDEAQNMLYDDIDSDLYVDSITNKYQEVFEWLDLIRQNLLIFLGLVLFVACFNMISIVLILIMERTQMIGILKALGAPNRLIRKVFAYNGIRLIVKGLLIGNIIGLGLSYLQYRFKIIPLDPENYYMSFVPITLNWPIIIGLNLLVLIVVSLVLSIPTMIISRIHPIKSIRFD